MKTTLKILGSVACLGAITLANVQAKAQCTTLTNHAIFVFDQSNSMNDNGSKTINGSVVAAPKWQVARDYANARFATLPPGTVVAVFGFGNTTIGGLDYPHPIVSFDQGLVKGTNDAAIVAAFTTATTIPTTYWTPFAAGTCDALYDIWEQGLFDPCERRRVFVMTDGMENSSPTESPCYSATSSTTQFNANLAGSGFGLEAGSWQRKVASLAYAADPNADQLDYSIYSDTDRPVVNVEAIFDYIDTTGAAVRRSSGPDSSPVAGTGLLSSDFGDTGLALLQGLTAVTHGSYFEATQVGGVATKIPLPGDTDPSPTRSCVDKADLNRIKEALNHVVATGDPTFSVQDLELRDVNDDLIVDSKDYVLAARNLGTCAQ